jgi:hypothetical protein
MPVNSKVTIAASPKFTKPKITKTQQVAINDKRRYRRFDFDRATHKGNAVLLVSSLMTSSILSDDACSVYSKPLLKKIPVLHLSKAATPTTQRWAARE